MIILAAVLAAVAPASAADEPSDSGVRPFSPGSFSLREADLRSAGAPPAAGFSFSPVRTGGGFPLDSPPPAGSRMGKKWGRAWFEFGLAFTYSAVNYWIKWAQFIEDWQYELTWKDQVKRFFTTDALKFDSNSFHVNWTHSLAGGVYYQFARTNYLSWLESLLLATGASLLWEYGVEWREVVSVNDNIFTGLGAYSIGEAWFQTARFLAAQPQVVLQAVSFMNPLLKLNQWLDRKKPASKDSSTPGWHDFEISVGARRLSRPGRSRQDGLCFGLRVELFGPPDFGKPGFSRRTIRDFLASEIVLDAARGGDKDVTEAFAGGWTEEDLAKGGWLDEVNFWAKAVNWAYYSQSFDELSRGTAFSVGLGSAFSYFRKAPALRIDTGEYRVRTGEDLKLENPRFFRDKISAVHMAGPVVDWRMFGREAKIRLTAEAYADFALVNSFALNAYSEAHDIAGMKTTLLHYGYYYALGISLKGRCDLEWRSIRFRSAASFQAWDSVEGLDRFQSDLTDDGDVDDSRIRGLLGVDWKVPRLPLRVFFTYEAIRRRGRLREIVVRGLEEGVFVGLSHFF